MNANRVGEHQGTLEDTVRDTRARRDSEKKRYLEQYGVDIKDLTNYSLIVDTTYATPDVISECIIESFNRWQEDKSFNKAYLSPERIFYPDDAADTALVDKYATMLERGEEIPDVTVFESDGEFYLLSGLESALAYSFNMSDFVPATLVKGSIDNKKYTRMRNSL